LVNQIVKKFENKKSKFDIDLFLDCLSKDIQEVAIEEFLKMSKNMGDSEETFKKEPYRIAKAIITVDYFDEYKENI
jgi:hypothetical protein